MEGFRIDLKTFFGLTNPLQLSESKYLGGFGGNNLGPESPTLYSTTDTYVTAYCIKILCFTI